MDDPVRRIRRILMVGGAPRYVNRFEPPMVSREPALEAVAAQYTPGDWIGGGEPTIRSDFLQLIRRCGDDVSLRTDGLAFVDATLVNTLIENGVGRVCIPIYSIRPDAHDWLSGVAGSGRRALKAIRTCVEQGLQVHVELVPTRPLAGLLMETIGVLGRLGVHSVWIRRPRLDWMDADESVSLSPRMGLLEPELVQIASAATRLGLRIHWVGWSTCAMPKLTGVRWQDDWVSIGVPPAGSLARTSCACSGACPGYPTDYIERFGWTEFEAYPATRVPDVVKRVISPGGPFPRGDEAIPETVRVVFGAPDPNWKASWADPVTQESSRVIRQRLVAASQTGARRLLVCNTGLLAHPDAADLLWELTRLSFERVHIAGELSPMAQFSERVYRRFRGIDVAHAILLGPSANEHDAIVGRPGAYDALNEVLDKLRRFSGMKTSVYAMLQSVEQLNEYRLRFSALQQPPHFRLAPTVNVAQFSAEVKHVDDPELRRSLERLLPPPVSVETEVMYTPAWGPGQAPWVSVIDPGLAPLSRSGVG